MSIPPHQRVDTTAKWGQGFPQAMGAFKQAMWTRKDSPGPQRGFPEDPTAALDRLMRPQLTSCAHFPAEHLRLQQDLCLVTQGVGPLHGQRGSLEPTLVPWRVNT